MVFGKIKPTATIVAQFAAGVEVEAIQHEGRMYLPVVSMGEFATSEPAPEKSKAVKKDEPAPSAEKSKAEKSEKASKETKTYTKDELMETDSKELVKILKNEFGINPDDYEGKNTNKKLRDLILDAQKNGGKKEEETEEEEEESSDETNLTDQVAEILEDFDAGKKNKKKAISAICALVDDADDDAVTELVEGFEEDGDADIDETASKIADVLEGKKSKKSAKKETEKETKKTAKKSKKEDLVDADDLEVGDRVSVWWDDDNQDWFDGEVKSIKKGKITIAYDDDTEEVIDPEVHTKIKRIAE